MREQRGNRTTTELRKTFQGHGPAERFALQLRMSRMALKLREAGRYARR